MKKNTKLAYSSLLIAFLVFCVIAFVIPTEKTATFWIAFIFSIIAFAVQIPIWKSALGNSEPLKSKFLGFPLIHIGFFYLVIQLISFAVFVAVPTLPEWVPIVICALILGTSIICLIAADAGKDEVIRVKKKVQSKVYFIKDLQAEVELLAVSEADKEVQNALEDFAEQVRFSDPMSNEALAEIERAITEKIVKLKTTPNNKMVIIQELSLLLVERNKKCILLK